MNKRSKLYWYYVELELYAVVKKRVTRVKASTPSIALRKALADCKKRGLSNIVSLAIREWPPEHTPLVPKEDVYCYVTTIDDRYYEHKRTGDRLSIEYFNSLPSMILPA